MSGQHRISSEVMALEARAYQLQILLGEVLATIKINRERGTMPIGDRDEHGADWDKWAARWRERFEELQD